MSPEADTSALSWNSACLLSPSSCLSSLLPSLFHLSVLRLGLVVSELFFPFTSPCLSPPSGMSVVKKLKGGPTSRQIFQRVKAVAAKLDDLSLTSVAYEEEREDQILKLAPCPPHKGHDTFSPAPVPGRKSK